MLVMVVFFIAFRWIHLSTPLIRLFLLVLILLLMPTLNFLPVWFALSLLRFRLPSRLPMMFILWMVAMMVVIIPSRTARKRSSPNVFEMAATETITSIILIKLIRVSLGTVRHPRRFKIVVIDIQITLKQMLRDFIGIRVNRAKKSGMVNI